jgi:hypothetical protein
LENFTCENTSGATFIQVSEYRHVAWWTFTFWFSKEHTYIRVFLWTITFYFTLLRTGFSIFWYLRIAAF